MRSAVIAGLAILLAGGVQAQYFVNYTAEQGLLSEDVRHVLLDQKGFLWVSSQEGLWRFDGGAFRRFDVDRPLRSGAPRDIVENMAIAPDGRIWTVSGATGLGVFDPATEHYTEWQELVGDNLPFPFRLSPGILVLNNDSILAVAEEHGLVLFLPGQRRWEILAPNPLEERLYARVIVRDRFYPRRIWIGASGRLLSCDLGSGKLVTHKFQDSIDNDEVVHIHAVDQDDDGTLWLGTWGDGIMHYDPGKGLAVAYLFDTIPPINGAKNIIQGMARRSAEEFFIGCEDGLRVFNTHSGFRKPIQHNPERVHSLPPGMVTNLMLAPTGITGRIDTNGVVTLKWRLGKEPDLYGYYVYFRNQKDHIEARVNGQPLRDTVFTDTISMHTLTEHIYYRVVAIDMNENQSPRGELIDLQRPDVRPPNTPVFTDYRVSRLC